MFVMFVYVYIMYTVYHVCVYVYMYVLVCMCVCNFMLNLKPLHKWRREQAVQEKSLEASASSSADLALFP